MSTPLKHNKRKGSIVQSDETTPNVESDANDASSEKVSTPKKPRKPKMTEEDR